MQVTDPKTIALRFNFCINTRDIQGLEHLMANNHVFIDSAGNVQIGKLACLSIWEEFFKMFPDYKNVFSTIRIRDNIIIMMGYSSCSDPRLDGPAIWSANIQNGKVEEWHVYEDTPLIRLELGI
jgi:hypothetical protein